MTRWVRSTRPSLSFLTSSARPCLAYRHRFEEAVIRTRTINTAPPLRFLNSSRADSAWNGRSEHWPGLLLGASGHATDRLGEGACVFCRLPHPVVGGLRGGRAGKRVDAPLLFSGSGCLR